jgi:hypothetical protein
MNVDHCASCMQSRSMEIRVDLRFFRGSACGPVIVPVFKTGGRQAILSLVGSTPTRFRHRPFGFICAEVLRRKRSGFRQRASASLTPAMRLKFDSHSLPPSSLRVHLRGGPSQTTLRISAAGFRFAHARYAPQVRLPLASAIVPSGFICAEVLRRKRSGFRQRASASLTPAMRLKFDSHSLPPSIGLSLAQADDRG